MRTYGTLADQSPCPADREASDWEMMPRGERPLPLNYTDLGVPTGSPSWYLAMQLEEYGEDVADYDVAAWGEDLRERVNRHLAPDLVWEATDVFRSTVDLDADVADRRIHDALHRVCPDPWDYEDDVQFHKPGDTQACAVDRYDRCRSPMSPEQIQDLWARRVPYIDRGERECVLTREELRCYVPLSQSQEWGDQMPQEPATRLARFWSSSWVDINEVPPSDYDDPWSVKMKAATEDVRRGAALPAVAHRSRIPVEELAPVRRQWLRELDQAHHDAR